MVLYVNQNARNFQMMRYGRMLARLRQPRRERQDVHDHEPVQGVRLQPRRGRRRTRPSGRGAVGLRPRQPGPSRSDARRPTTSPGSCRTPPTSGPSCSTRRRGRATARAAAYGSIAIARVTVIAEQVLAIAPPPARLPPAPAKRRASTPPTARRTSGSSRRSARPTPLTRRRSTLRRRAASSAGSWRPPTWRSPTSRPWSTTASPAGSRSSSPGPCRPGRDRRERLPVRAEWLDAAEAADVVARVDAAAQRCRGSRATAALGRAVLRRHDPWCRHRAVPRGGGVAARAVADRRCRTRRALTVDRHPGCSVPIPRAASRLQPRPDE